MKLQNSSTIEQSSEALIKQYQRLVSYIESNSLEDAWNLAPILNVSVIIFTSASSILIKNNYREIKL